MTTNTNTRKNLASLYNRTQVAKTDAEREVAKLAYVKALKEAGR